MACRREWFRYHRPRLRQAPSPCDRAPPPCTARPGPRRRCCAVPFAHGLPQVGFGCTLSDEPAMCKCHTRVGRGRPSLTANAYQVESGGVGPGAVIVKSRWWWQPIKDLHVWPTALRKSDGCRKSSGPSAHHDRAWRWCDEPQDPRREQRPHDSTSLSVTREKETRALGRGITCGKAVTRTAAWHIHTCNTHCIAHRQSTALADMCRPPFSQRELAARYVEAC